MYIYHPQPSSTRVKTMNTKIVAVALVAILVVAGVAVFFLMGGKGGSTSDEKGLSIVGRVNSEGSGIILDPEENEDDYITVTDEPLLGSYTIYNKSEGKYYNLHANGWGGKIFATPGTATIQHVQLATLAAGMGLNFAMYTEGSTPKADTLYYVPSIASFADFVNAQKNTDLAGFIIWEAQYSVGVVEGYKGLVTTNSLFEDHTCCIIGASNKYLKNNEDAFVTFLSVYANAVDKINGALANKASTEYNDLVNIAMNRVTMPDSMTEAEKREAIESALDNVTYVYADDYAGSLDDLEEDIASLAQNLYDVGAIEKTAKSLGFKDYEAMADKFVDDKYITEALQIDAGKLSAKATVNVAAIKGDIHQIALWYAKDTGMFDAMNLNVVISQQVNGPGVYTQLANGESDIGFLGAPPMTIRSVNGEQIHARAYR